MKKILILIVSITLASYLFAENTLGKLKQTLNTNNYVLSWYFDVLQSKERNTVNKFTAKLHNRSYFDIDGSWEVIWYSQDIFEIETLKIYDGNSTDLENAIVIGNSHYFITTSIQTIRNTIFLLNCYKTTYNEDDFSTINWDPVRIFFINADNYKLLLSIDGDYIHVYYDAISEKKHICSFCKMNDVTLNEFKSVIFNNTCDLSRVTWPRHADGSCDYETTVRLQSGKRYRASDNLRLRSSGSTAGEPVVTIGKGSAVKVLAVGAEQTIDNITGNWVQVEVQAGAKDRDGKAITTGTVGWCFFGGGGIWLSDKEVRVFEENSIARLRAACFGGYLVE